MKHFWPPHQRLIGEDKDLAMPVPDFREILKGFAPETTQAPTASEIESAIVRYVRERSARDPQFRASYLASQAEFDEFVRNFKGTAAGEKRAGVREMKRMGGQTGAGEAEE